jgi:hypothetical protein
MVRTLATLLIGFIITSCSIVDSSKHYEVDMKLQITERFESDYPYVDVKVTVKNTGFRSQWVMSPWIYGVYAYEKLENENWIRTLHTPITTLPVAIGPQEIRPGDSFTSPILIYESGTYRLVIELFKSESFGDEDHRMYYTTNSFEVEFPIQTTD